MGLLGQRAAGERRGELAPAHHLFAGALALMTDAPERRWLHPERGWLDEPADGAVEYVRRDDACLRTALRALEAENARLREEVADRSQYVDELQAEIRGLEFDEGQARDRTKAVAHERDAALAEVERLKEALEMIAGCRQCPDGLMSNEDIARAALAAQAETGGE
jgi:hypothetical protein